MEKSLLISNSHQDKTEFEYKINNIKEELERFRDTPNGILNPYKLLYQEVKVGQSSWLIKIYFDVSLTNSNLLEDFFTYINWNPGPISVTGPIPKMLISIKSMNMSPTTLVPYIEFRPECIREPILGMGVDSARKQVVCLHKNGEFQWKFQPGEERIVEGVDLRKVASLGPTIGVFFSLAVVQTEIRKENGDTGVEVLKDMIDMFESGAFKDFTVKVNGDEIKCHKSVLSARSVFFRQMLSSNMLETKTDTFKIEHTEVETKSVKAMLKFIYSGFVDNSDNFEELLLLADYFSIDGLKNEVENQLGTKLLKHEENAVKYFVLADQYNAKQVKSLAKICLLENSEMFLRDEHIKDFLSKDLMFELIQGLVTKDNKHLA